MSKNLIFLADGTGNDSDVTVSTNVYKLYLRLRKDSADPSPVAEGTARQVVMYDAGIGAGSGFAAFIAQATGKGISQNVKDGYAFICRHYEPGDRIYLFGFSRGAYTVRSLGGLLGLCGIAARIANAADPLYDAKNQINLVDEAFGIYRLPPGTEREEAAKHFYEKCWPGMDQPVARAPYMIGVWDTVRALGFPTGKGDLVVLGQDHRFHDHELNPNVRYAFHALSIEDRRMQFYPTIWNEPTMAEKGGGIGAQQVFEQVWFPGVHADVGGGYQDSSLSDVTLEWMINQISRAEHPPLFSEAFAADPTAGLSPVPWASSHDSRDKSWKRLLYKEQARDVVRGTQKSGAKSIEPLPDKGEQGSQNKQEAYLAKCLVQRYETHSEGRLAPPVVIEKHSDIVLLLKQIADALTDRGPFNFLR